MAKGQAKGEEPLLTRQQLAVVPFLIQGKPEVHPITITKWEREGMPVAKRGGRGRPSFYLESAVRAWLLAREAAADGPDGPLDLVQERARKEKWLALLAEQKFKVLERKLLPIEDVERTWLAEVTAVRAIILASYTADADRIFRAATLDGVVGVERELKDLSERVLRELSAPAATAPKRRRKKAA